MPIYEFRCESCQEVFEHLAFSQGEMLDLRCPKCAGEKLSRVLSTCASVVSDGGGAAAGSACGGPQMQSRSCGQASNCSTLTLPGHTR